MPGVFFIKMGTEKCENGLNCKECDIDIVECDVPQKRKVYLTYNQQVQTLSRRNLEFHDTENAEYVLQNISYYRLANAYKEYFISQKSVETNKDDYNHHYFEELVKVHDFDKQIGAILFKYILRIENTLRSVLAYSISGIIGYEQKDYLNVYNYNEGKKYYNPAANRCVSERETTFGFIDNARNNRHSKPIQHYIAREGNIPPWIIMFELDFGKVIFWYKLCKEDIHTAILERVLSTDNCPGLESRKSLFMNSLELCSHYRNAIAHGQRVINNDCTRELPKFPLLEYVNLKCISEEIYLNKIQKNPFASIVVAVYILFSKRKTVRSEFVRELKTEFEMFGKHYPDIHGAILKEMDLPENFFSLFDDLLNK